MSDITDIYSLVQKVEEVKKLLSPSGQIWWRGQNEYKWKIQPSIFREEFEEYHEKSGALRFMHKAHARHSSVPPMGEKQNWLFLMQHYGLPTRLLDWTESPLIACFFATEPSYSKSDGAIYALSPHSLNESQLGIRQLLMPYDKPVNEIIDSVFSENQKASQQTIAIRPAEVDIRLLTQMSVFTLHGSKELLEDNPNSQKFIIKLKIPKKSKTLLQRQLKHLGIRLSNIFPDLEHLAKDIKSTKFKNSKKNSKASNFNLETEDEGFTISGEAST